MSIFAWAWVNLPFAIEMFSARTLVAIPWCTKDLGDCDNRSLPPTFRSPIFGIFSPRPSQPS
ncbi:hypothetical protein [Streptomyces sp. 3213.3]|uniref:hypothetical protein n=1 Tax=Streptomyces sp. 3213.3 TaxID=1855348 RepID=UPI000B837D24|nr:hypothetical protein [Streptomyces sp. 3213.3]